MAIGQQFRRLAPLTALLVLVCLSGARAFGQMTGTITGEIRVARSTFPVHHVLVTLLTRGVNAGVVYADNEGRFNFPNLPGNIYHIVIQDEAYEPYEETVSLDPRVSLIKFVQVTLTPKGSTEKPVNTEPEQVAGGNPYLVSAKEYNQRFPKKAIREFDAGVEADSRQQVPESIKHFHKALALAPDFYPAHNNLGSAYLKQGDMAGASREFAEVVRLNPNDGSAYFNLGNVLYLTGHYDEALEKVQEGLRRQPNAAFGLFVQGSIYTSTNKPQEAERSLRDSMRQDPKLGYVRLQLVKLYLGQRRNDQAVAELKVFLKDFPGDPLAPKAEHLLHGLENPTSK